MTSDIIRASHLLPAQHVSREDRPAVTAQSRREANSSQTPVDDRSAIFSPHSDYRNDDRGRLVKEGARLAEQLEVTQTAARELENKRNQLKEQAANKAANETETPQQTLQRIRAAALEARFGTGKEDAGPLAVDSYFVTDNPVARLDNAISALERQVALTESNIKEIEFQFSQTQDELLSEHSEPISEPDLAQKTAQTVSAELKTEPMAKISTLTLNEGTAILALLDV